MAARKTTKQRTGGAKTGRAPKGLLIHIGAPKTGSTALQNFLLTNEAPLAAKGICFLASGRTNISHNNLFNPLRGPDAAAIWSDIADEAASHPESLSIMSSENFFSPTIAASVAQHMPESLRKTTRFIAYVRRQDAYLEALYKQKTKNGREHSLPLEFVKKHVEIGNYQTVLDAFADTVGDENVILRRFERSAMKGGDVVADFLGCLGLDAADSSFVQPVHEANQSLSRAVTEQMGALARHSRLNVRELAREMMRDPANAAPRRSGDVFTKDQRLEIMALFEASNAELARRYLKDDSSPFFDLQDLAPDMPDRYPDPEEEIALYAEAQEKVAAAIGRITRRNPAKLFRG